MFEVDYETALYQFKEYVETQKRDSDTLEKIKGINKKILHTIDVVSYGEKIIEELGFNESFKNLSKIALLDHDIGRFPQMRYLATYKDYELKKSGYFNVDNHGQLGKIILEQGILKKQIPRIRLYDECILNVVNNHVDNISEYKDLLILTNNILKNQSIYEFFTKADDSVQKSFISSLTQLVQDIDRLDIYYQILDGRFKCEKSEEEINPIILDKFYKGEYLNINLIKESGLWNSNIGELVRLSFINQIRILSVAKLIKEQKIIERIKEINNNKKVKEAYDITILKLNEMINNSQDGATTGPVKKLLI